MRRWKDDANKTTTVCTIIHCRFAEMTEGRTGNQAVARHLHHPAILAPCHVTRKNVMQALAWCPCMQTRPFHATCTHLHGTPCPCMQTPPFHALHARTCKVPHAPACKPLHPLPCMHAPAWYPMPLHATSALMRWNQSLHTVPQLRLCHTSMRPTTQRLLLEVTLSARRMRPSAGQPGQKKQVAPVRRRQ